MRLIVIHRLKARAVVLYNDLAAGICLTGDDRDVDLIAACDQTMLNGILYDRLQSQRRQTEVAVFCIKVDKKCVFKLRLLNGEVGMGMLQLFRKGNVVFVCDSGEVLAQVGSEIQRYLLCLLYVLIAKVVDPHHGVAYKVRTHLQYHNSGVLMGNFLLL